MAGSFGYWALGFGTVKAFQRTSGRSDRRDSCRGLSHLHMRDLQNSLDVIGRYSGLWLNLLRSLYGVLGASWKDCLLLLRVRMSNWLYPSSFSSMTWYMKCPGPTPGVARSRDNIFSREDSSRKLAKGPIS